MSRLYMPGYRYRSNLPEKRFTPIPHRFWYWLYCDFKGRDSLIKRLVYKHKSIRERRQIKSSLEYKRVVFLYRLLGVRR